MKKRTDDEFEITFGGGEEEQEKMRDELALMENPENSTWHRDIPVTGCELQDLDYMTVVTENYSELYHMDEELLMDTASENGSRLMLNAGGIPLLVRKTAIPSLYQTAKLYGSALGRMTPYLLKETLNNAFSVGNGKVLALERYGKLTACHSDGDGGYAIMPISELFDISIASLKEKFGYIEMASGYNSHEFTRATWQLISAQDELMEKYQKAIRPFARDGYVETCMPAARFSSSDTSNCCAILEPVFITGKNAEISFSSGVSVKHRRQPAGADQPMDVFASESKELFAKFEETIEKISELAQRRVYHPENFVVSICKKLKIAKKYGEAARVEAEQLKVGEPYISGYDLYMALMEIIESAKNYAVSSRLLLELDEKISKVPIMDWDEHDVGGTVAWSDT